MLAKIVEVSTVTDTSLTHMLIHIWSSKASYDRDDKPSGDNAFVMDIVASEDTPFNVRHHIEEYLSRRSKGTKSHYPPFHAKPSISRGSSDPKGILLIAELLDMRVAVK